jgi:hypothetical protein
MAIGTSFKQQCPSCEAMVPVKDVGMVGKKIECPKCKDKFIVQAPAKEKVPAEEASAAKSKANSKTAPSSAVTKKPVPRGAAKEVDAKTAPKPAAAGAKEAQADGKDAAATKPKAKTSRFTLGIALGVVGLVVLATAFYFLFLNKKDPPRANPSKKGPYSAPPVVAKGKNKEKEKDNEVEVKDKDKKDTPKAKEKTPTVDVVPLSTVQAELTNLLPNDTQYVAHVPLRNLLDPSSVSGNLLRDALFQTPGALNEDLLRDKLGFSVLDMDDLIRAERYGPGGWSFSVAHFQRAIDQDAVVKALNLKPAPAVNKKYLHYQALAPNPWFEPLARLAVGVPRPLRVERAGNRPLFVHFHDPQTIVFADEAPMAAFLKEDKRFKALIESDAKAPAPPGGRLEPFATIKPALRSMVERMRTVATDGKDMVLFSSAAELDAAEAVLRPRVVWDVTVALQERQPRIRVLGVALLLKGGRFFQMRNELQCPVENDAKVLHDELADNVAYEAAHFIERVLGHKVEVPKKDVPIVIDPKMNKRPPPGYPRGPRPPFGKLPDQPKEKKEQFVSKITVDETGKNVTFVLDLKLEQAEMNKLSGLASLMGCGLRGAMDVAAAAPTRTDLAKAAKLLAEQGLSDRKILPGRYPPGAFPRPGGNLKRYVRLPMERVSWMAGLLPFLGQKTIYDRINFDASWRDPSNWAAAGTLVPEFLDPTYPASLHYLSRPDLPFDPAATHFVGIAGVGLDAADYDPADPATLTKRGVMSYDHGITLDEIRKGHGLGNTIVMVQIPPDDPTGVGAWMAGGGSTLRGVPDKNSIAPFVSTSTGKDGKARRGTHVLMADGTVRFVDESVSDAVFKAMATATAPLPENFDLDGPDSKAPRVDQGVQTKKAAAKEPVRKSPEKKDPAPPKAPASAVPEKLPPPTKTSRATFPRIDRTSLVGVGRLTPDLERPVG